MKNTNSFKKIPAPSHGWARPPYPSWADFVKSVHKSTGVNRGGGKLNLSQRREGFVLVAVIAVTSFCLVLTAALITAKSQHSFYVNRAAERVVTETAAYIEAQDFVRRARNTISTVVTSQNGGFLDANSIFSSTPFIRAEVRAGTGITADGQAPLVYQSLTSSNLSVTISPQQAPLGATGVTNAKVVSVPFLWQGGGSPPPSPVGLGVDDPYADITCRASYFGISAYSVPRTTLNSGGSWEGFANSIIIAVRAFPVSAFTSAQFSPSSSIDYSGIPSSLLTLPAGRVYSSGSINVGSSVHFNRMVALSGVTTTVTTTVPPSTLFFSSPSPGSGVTITAGSGSAFGGDTVIDASVLRSVWPIERFNSLRGYIVSADNGGLPLVQPGPVSTLSNLMNLQQQQVDCSITFVMGPQKTSTNGVPPPPPQPIIGSGGAQISTAASKTLDPIGLVPTTNALKNPPFFLVPNPNNAPGGKIVFDPGKLSFSPNSATPYSIYINNTCDNGTSSAWTLCVSTSSGSPGITLISPQSIFLEGNFITSGYPSMIVSPAVYACAPLAGAFQQPLNVNATVITTALSPMSLFLSPSSSSTASTHPPPASYVNLTGSAIAWDQPSSIPLTVPTYPQAGGQSLLNGTSAPALVPAVTDVRISGSLVSSQKQSFQ